MKKDAPIFFYYLRHCRNFLLWAVVCAVIFFVLFYLYGIDWKAVGYPLLLCVFFSAVLFLIGFWRFVKKHKMLQKMKNDICVLAEELPEAEGLIEQDYTELLACLGREMRKRLTLYRQQKKEKEEYYAAWVHQIKAPIAVMQLILQASDIQENRELLSELFRIEQYAEMALCYIRLEDDVSDLVLKEYPLDPIIRASVRKYAAQFVHRHIRLEYQGTDARVLTDEKWLSFVIEQLLSNAVKYTKKGCVTISAEGAVLKIADTSIGIAPEDTARIFEKGFTGYNGRADKKSTGIGLYLVKKAADRLGHRITVESVQNKGTVFTVDMTPYALQAE